MHWKKGITTHYYVSIPSPVTGWVQGLGLKGRRSLGWGRKLVWIWVGLMVQR